MVSYSRTLLLLLFVTLAVSSVALNRAAYAVGPLVDLNTANAELLAGILPGIGPTKAKAIVAYREKHGPFDTIDTLIEVKGIGEITLTNIRPFLFVGVAGQEQSGLYPSVKSHAKVTVLSESEGRPFDQQSAAQNGEQLSLAESEAAARRAVQAALQIARRLGERHSHP